MIITITRRHEYKRGTVLGGSGEKEGEKERILVGHEETCNIWIA
jgi:hypothetical protein